MKRTAVVVLHIGYWGLYLMLIVCFIQMMPVTNKITGMNRMLMERIGRLLRVLFFYPVGTVAFFAGAYWFLFVLPVLVPPVPAAEKTPGPVYIGSPGGCDGWGRYFFRFIFRMGSSSDAQQ